MARSSSGDIMRSSDAPSRQASAGNAPPQKWTMSGRCARTARSMSAAVSIGSAATVTSRDARPNTWRTVSHSSRNERAAVPPAGDAASGPADISKSFCAVMGGVPDQLGGVASHRRMSGSAL